MTQNRDLALANISTMCQQEGHQVDMQQCVQLIMVVLLGCLFVINTFGGKEETLTWILISRENGQTYAARRTGGTGRQAQYERCTYSVPYFKHPSIPISDVYGALGKCNDIISKNLRTH